MSKWKNNPTGRWVGAAIVGAGIWLSLGSVAYRTAPLVPAQGRTASAEGPCTTVSESEIRDAQGRVLSSKTQVAPGSCHGGHGAVAAGDAQGKALSYGLKLLVTLL